MLMEAVDEQVRTLTKADRCDADCTAQAYILAVKDSLDLQFCLHHGNENAAGLIGQGFVMHVQDVDF